MRKEERDDIIEELAMVLCHIDGLYWNDLTLTEASDYKKKTELVCLKVDRELPVMFGTVESYLRGFQKMREAGYVAVEPLVGRE